MTKLQTVLLVVAFLAGCFIVFSIEENRLRKQESKVITIAKEKAVLEYKYKDSLRVVNGYLKSLSENHFKQIDSLIHITQKINHAKQEISFIHPESLPPNELDRIITERYNHPSIP